MHDFALGVHAGVKRLLEGAPESPNPLFGGSGALEFLCRQGVDFSYIPLDAIWLWAWEVGGHRSYGSPAYHQGSARSNGPTRLVINITPV